MGWSMHPHLQLQHPGLPSQPYLPGGYRRNGNKTIYLRSGTRYTQSPLDGGGNCNCFHTLSKPDDKIFLSLPLTEKHQSHMK